LTRDLNRFKLFKHRRETIVKLFFETMQRSPKAMAKPELSDFSSSDWAGVQIERASEFPLLALRTGSRSPSGRTRAVARCLQTFTRKSSWTLR
jgi:hypothetical protein